MKERKYNILAIKSYVIGKNKSLLSYTYLFDNGCEIIETQSPQVLLDAIWESDNNIIIAENGKIDGYNIALFLEVFGYRDVVVNPRDYIMETIIDDNNNFYSITLTRNIEDEYISKKIIFISNFIETDYSRLSLIDKCFEMQSDIDKIMTACKKLNINMLNFITLSQISKSYFISKVWGNLDNFHKEYGITNIQAQQLYDLHIYLGGKSIINTSFIDKVITKPINIYDINSLYPSILRNMQLPIMLIDKDNPCKMPAEYLYVIENIRGDLKPNKLPIWEDNITGENVTTIYEPEKRAFWQTELECIKQYYNLQYDVISVYKAPLKQLKGIKTVIDNLFDYKAKAKNKTDRAIYKGILNKFTGKLGQLNYSKVKFFNCSQICERENYVNAADYSPLSILIASYITMQGRVKMLNLINNKYPNNMTEEVIYGNTDSLFTFKELENSTELGHFGLRDKPKAFILKAKNTYLYKSDKGYKCASNTLNSDYILKELCTCYSFKQAVGKFDWNKEYYCPVCKQFVNGKKIILIKKKLLANSNDEVLKFLEENNIELLT